MMLYRIPGVIIGFGLHEFAHALAAHKLGDPTPEREGRLTLNPKVHLDPLGLILLILVGFGWAKPIHIEPRYFKNPKRDQMLVALAGPVMNLIVAALFFIGFKLSIIFGLPELLGADTFGVVQKMFYFSAYINVLLCFFNLIPLAPLDGYTVLHGLLPYQYHQNIAFLEAHGPTILMILLVLTFTPLNILFWILDIPIGFTMQLLSALSSFIPGGG